MILTNHPKEKRIKEMEGYLYHGEPIGSLVFGVRQETQE